MNVYEYIHKDIYVLSFISINTLLVCLFVSNKRQNVWTDRNQILCETSLDPREIICMIKISIILNFENPRIFFF